MKNLAPIFFASFFFFSFIAIQNQLADYEVNSDFMMKIKGSSNVHDWESTIEKMDGTASISFNDSGEISIASCEVTIPVNAIKSSKGNRMDKKTMKALNEKEFPSITYSLIRCDNIVMTDGQFSAQTTGNLIVSGATKLIDMEITGKTMDDGRIEITGAKDMRMTDFNISPPTALLGTMRTKDEITIEFRVTLANPNL
jgi:polyisoprenoid-binding protein YceI